MIHRHLLRTLERAMDRIRRAHLEVAGEGVADGRLLVDLDVVAGRAGDAVAGEPAVLRVLFLLLRGGLEGDGVHRSRGRRAGAARWAGSSVEPQEVRVVADLVRLLGIALELVEAELPLPHDAVAVEAEVRDQLGQGGVGVCSVSSCEKKTGSRPASPMGEPRHSP